jgi:AcrR family transcriptional regulator
VSEAVSPPKPRAPRADAARNRARLLDAAKAVFAAGGADASLEAVARRAGVGVGTLYRHFPTRDALYEAVYRREVDDLTALAERLQHEAAPEAALRAWVGALIEFVATKKGMAAALALAAHNKTLSAYSFERLTGAVGLLLDRLASANGLRRKIAPEDFLRALIGVTLALDGPDWRNKATPLMDVFIDGLMRAR